MQRVKEITVRSWLKNACLRTCPRITCDVCDKEFQPKNSRAKRCSRLCSNAHFNNLLSTRRLAQRTELTCANCNRSFTPSRLRSKEVTYCSRKCWRQLSYKTDLLKWKTNRKSIKCIQCQIWFKPRSRKIKAVCSSVCRRKRNVWHAKQSKARK